MDAGDNMAAKQDYLKRKIGKLKREIAEIDEAFYVLNERADLTGHASMLERKRDDVIRGAVLQLHTSIEDILNSMIMCRILGVSANKRRGYTSSPRGKALQKMMMSAEGLGFDQKLDLAVALRVVTDRIRKRLSVLNTLRNKCGHHWLLKAPVRRGRRRRQLKPPLLLYENRDLHQVDTFKDFLAEFGPLYINLFMKYLDYHDDI
jgi:hypothetical protein